MRTQYGFNVILLVFSLFYAQISLAIGQVDFLGVLIPKQIQLNQARETVSLQGYAAKLINGEPFYVGAFFSSKPEKRPSMLLLSDSPMAMICYIVQDDVNPDIIRRIFTEEILVNNPGWESETLNKSRLVELQSVFQNTYNAGDILGFEYSSSGELVFTINGGVLKSWPNGRTLFNALLRTWIGPYPPSREFKEAILGN
jgi:hypothetical protein